MRILIIGPAWVGDMVMSQSLMIALANKYPDLELDVVAPHWSHPLLERMPQVRQSFALPVNHGELGLKKRRTLAKKLQQNQYHQAIILPNSFKSALVPYWAKIPIRTGWRGEYRYGLLNDLRILNKNKWPKMTDRFIALAYSPEETITRDYDHFFPKLEVNEENVEQAQNAYKINTNKPVLVLCPGAEYGPSKQWPFEYFAQVAQKFIDIYSGQVWVLGSMNDKNYGEKIKSKVTNQNKIFNLCGDTSLAQAIDLMSVADCVLTNDSGLMHIAASLDRPLVSIYGSTSPEFTPPLSRQVSIIKSNIHCSPCFKRHCPYNHLKCLYTIEPDQVMKAVSQRLHTTTITLH